MRLLNYVAKVCQSCQSKEVHKRIEVEDVIATICLACERKTKKAERDAETKLEAYSPQAKALWNKLEEEGGLVM